MWCSSPIVIYKRGTVPTMNVATGLPEWPSVACGRCKTCVAGRKNDWAGRLIAEATTAKAVYFLTLTYADEPDHFRYRDVQLMMYALRTQLAREFGGTKVRFFCVGERGNKFGRRHWHLLLFFDAPHQLRRMKKRELWEHWQHGWASIERVPTHDTVRRVRYCAKYAVKDLGADDMSCRIRCSLKPAIGGAYLKERAEFAAEAALPINGFFTLPGMVWDRGRQAGKHVRYRLKGASARMFCRVYTETWERVRRDRPWPRTPFLDRYYPDHLVHRMEMWPETRPDPFDWRSGGPSRLKRPPPTEGQMDKMLLEGKVDVDTYAAFKAAKVAAAKAFAERRALENDEFAAGLEFRRIEDGKRYRAAAAFGAGHDCGLPLVARWIETGAFDYQTDGIRDSAFARWLEGEGLEWGPQVDHRQAGLRTEAHGYQVREEAQRRAIAQAGLRAVEIVDPVTGECSIAAGNGPEGAEGSLAEGFEEHRHYRPKPGGLADRAASRARGTPEACQGSQGRGEAA